ncbi:putative acyl-CoA dehydrogenase [Entophlyctis helioformis]|nr:putative acyl-CoA dehydrogenase [Entophlyctis helioformis]
MDAQPVAPTAAKGALKTLSLAELARHNTDRDCWIAVRGRVYDVTRFLDVHPGGKRILLTVAGQDATKAFELHHQATTVLAKYDAKLVVGVLDGYEPSSDVAESYGRDAFGDKLAFADPAWYQDWHSPYYKDSHRRLRVWAREVVERELMPYIADWDKAGKAPADLYKRFGDLGLLPAVTGAKTWPSQWTKHQPPCGIKPEEWDAFHEMVIGDELARIASAGVGAVLTLGPSIALPPIMKYGSPKMQEKIIPAVLDGTKTIALAITEPFAGSDVANIQTTAVPTPDGKSYVINGEKKWITNGTWADYFVVAARTGGKGMGGISLFLVDRSKGGIETRPVPCQGNVTSGTAFVVLENCVVNAEDIIGSLNKGFKCIMSNFNHERLGICVTSIRSARVCYEVAMKYANKRRTFGQKLFTHGVIRNKLAHMARQIEASQAWLELIVYQLSIMSEEEAMLRMGGPIALLKAQSTVTMEYCAREASQVLGGVGYTKGGIGEKVERIYRDVRGMAIPGGSEEIMLDLGIRQAVKVSEMMGAKL